MPPPKCFPSSSIHQSPISSFFLGLLSLDFPFLFILSHPPLESLFPPAETTTGASLNSSAFFLFPFPNHAMMLLD